MNLNFKRSAVTLAVIGALGLGAIAAEQVIVPTTAATAVAPAATAPQLAALQRNLPSFADLVAAQGPAVVQIRASREARRVSADRESLPNMPDELAPFFRGQPRGRMPGPAMGTGSGFIVDADGVVLTNAHVVANADEVLVKLTDQREYRAKVLGSDVSTDVAVLKIEAKNLPVVKLGDPAATRVGDWVVAIGTPYGLDNTVTSGIVSAKSRSLPGDGVVPFIQTDAAVNPGNSGGPLVNLQGEIIGINTAIATRTGGFQGISFAIPANTVQNTVDQLIDSGSVERGYLGIAFSPVTPSLARALDVPLTAAQISQINSDAQGRQPAYEAGLRPEDVITAVDGHQLTDSGQLVSLISNKRPGDTVELTYNRGGNVSTATVTLGRRPDGDLVSRNGGNPSQPIPDTEPTRMDGLGLELHDLSSAAGQRFGLSKDVVEGVLISEVERGTEAYRDANLRPGDVITEVNRAPVKTVAEFQSVYREVRGGDTFLIRVVRGNNSFLTALTKPR